jgi:sodium-dependent dicarboxylate transporter 2/3/5
MQRWDLHRRLALTIIAALGARPVNLIGGFMLAAGFLSMWVSNTATAVMMLPIGASVIERVLQSQGLSTRDAMGRNFAIAMMLGIAYACSIGGMGTLIGTPPNALLAAFLSENYGYNIGFGQWMLLGVPLVVLGLPLTWLLLTRWVYPVRLPPAPGGASTVREELQQMGSWSRGELLVAVVFCATAAAWIFRPLLQHWVPTLSDAGIAMIGAIVLFLLPVDLRRGEFALNWDWARRIPWEVLILFGGGLALADAINSTGLAAWIGNSLSATAQLPTIVIVLAVVTLIIFLTELTSNTAVTATFLPVLAALAIGIGENPLLLALPAALAARCAFMMPVATPPNAIVYGSGYLTIPQMVRAGFWLNLLFIGLIITLGYGLAIWVFRIG